MSDSANPWTVACQAPLIRGILQARILEWIAIPFSRGFFRPRDWTHVSCTAGRFFTIWAARKSPISEGDLVQIDLNLGKLPLPLKRVSLTEFQTGFPTDWPKLVSSPDLSLWNHLCACCGFFFLFFFLHLSGDLWDHFIIYRLKSIVAN